MIIFAKDLKRAIERLPDPMRYEYPFFEMLLPIPLPPIMDMDKISYSQTMPDNKIVFKRDSRTMEWTIYRLPSWENI